MIILKKCFLLEKAMEALMIVLSLKEKPLEKLMGMIFVEKIKQKIGLLHKILKIKF
jgi:hypothetical protein